MGGNKMAKKMTVDFQWNGKFYGHKEFKRSNGRITKYYVASNGHLDDLTEILIDEYTAIAEKYAFVFGH